MWTTNNILCPCSYIVEHKVKYDLWDLNVSITSLSSVIRIWVCATIRASSISYRSVITVRRHVAFWSFSFTLASWSISKCYFEYIHFWSIMNTWSSHLILVSRDMLLLISCPGFRLESCLTSRCWRHLLWKASILLISVFTTLQHSPHMSKYFTLLL